MRYEMYGDMWRVITQIEDRESSEELQQALNEAVRNSDSSELFGIIDKEA